MSEVLVIRADASERIGTGHVMRMMALAQAWESRGGRAVFLCCLCPELLRSRIEGEGFDFIELGDVEIGSSEDAKTTSELIISKGAGAVAVDGYGFTIDYQRSLSKLSCRLLILDDFGYENSWSCDFLLNQNPDSNKRTYSHEVSGAETMTGMRFALLRKEFWNCRPGNEDQCAQRPLLITMGGADGGQFSLKLLSVLEQLTLPSLEIDVLCGSAHTGRSEIERAAEESRHSITILDPVDEMCSLLSQYEKIISGSGSSVYETLSVGSEFGLVCLADNQKGICNWLQSQGFAPVLGNYIEGINEQAVDSFMMHGASNQKNNPLLGVDAKGAKRVAAALSGRLKIVFLTAESGWMKAMLRDYINELVKEGHEVTLCSSLSDLPPDGDFLFLLSCWELVKSEVRERFLHTLVVHGSDLPEGRGWSPVTWRVLDGEKRIPMTLFEAMDEVDAGPIYLRSSFEVEETDLIEDIRKKVCETTLEMVRAMIEGFPKSISDPVSQTGEPTFYRRRTPDDSQISIDQTFREVFPLLQVVDNDSYPAFFDYRGERFEIKISRK